MRCKMKKLALPITIAAALLAACGDDVENNTINQMGMEVVDSEDDLPECSDKNEGEQAFVKGETSARICVDGEWLSMASDGSGNGDFNCKTVELKDKSGLKIVCNGDSIGVVLNGAKGDKGEDGQNGTKGENGAKGDSGAGCTLKDRTETSVTVACGDSTMVIELGRASGDDTATISLDTLEGYTQKGPFLKGSSVYLYELNGSLNQTNGNFTSVIASDDGRYRFRTRGLKYPYAMVVVDGYYRNEVTGETSDAPIRLRAITDVSGRVTGSANVNLLTHLEYERANNLATGPGKLKLKEAKHRAQAEILDAFHIDTNLVKNVQSEDMDVFGKTDADAALLAISVLLQGDGKVADLAALLIELADDFADGKWDGDSSAARKAALADWAAMADGMGRLDEFRKNVAGWGLSDTVPVFEKFVRKFYTMETGLGKCGSEDIPVGTVKSVTNPKSIYRDELYSDSASMIRFVCDDAEKARWRLQSDIEKDTLGWGDTTEGTVRNGRINPNLTYVYQDTSWRYGTAMDSLLVKVGGTACLNDGDTSKVTYDNLYYMCVDQTAGDTTRKWVVASDIFNDTWEMQDGCRELGVYGLGNIVAGRVNTERNYVCENGAFRPVTNNELLKGRVCVDYIQGQIFKVSGKFQKCDDKKWKAVADIGATGVMKDAAGREYKTILVGDQLWMKENLNYEVSGSYCYNNSSDMCAKYGRLYTWRTASKVCPTGWHLPKLTELSTLVTYVQSNYLGEPVAGEVLKATYYWSDSGKGTDFFGFSALPAGYYDVYTNDFRQEGVSAYILSSTEHSSSGVNCLLISGSTDAVNVYGCIKDHGYSVRCILDD